MVDSGKFNLSITLLSTVVVPVLPAASVLPISNVPNIFLLPTA